MKPLPCWEAEGIIPKTKPVKPSAQAMARLEQRRVPSGTDVLSLKYVEWSELHLWTPCFHVEFSMLFPVPGALLPRVR